MSVTLAERIAALLKESPGRSICVGCVARTLELPHKRTHQGMLKLEAFSNVQRFFGRCAVCRKTRLVVVAGTASVASPSGVPTEPGSVDGEPV
jgi:hypothetical protein